MENRLEEIKDNYAKEHDYENWTDFINDAAHWMVEKHMDDICQRYATECCQATLDKAAGNKYLQGQMMPVGNGIDGVVYESVESIIKNNQNIVLL